MVDKYNCRKICKNFKVKTSLSLLLFQFDNGIKIKLLENRDINFIFYFNFKIYQFLNKTQFKYESVLFWKK